MRYDFLPDAIDHVSQARTLQAMAEAGARGDPTWRRLRPQPNRPSSYAWVFIGRDSRREQLEVFARNTADSEVREVFHSMPTRWLGRGPRKWREQEGWPL